MKNKQINIGLIVSQLIKLVFLSIALVIESTPVVVTCLLISCGTAVVQSRKYPAEPTWGTYALLGVALVVMFFLGIKEVSMYLLIPVGIILLTLLWVADYNDRVREEK